MVIASAREARSIDRKDVGDNCTPKNGCISLVCGYAEYTYNANTVYGFVNHGYGDDRYWRLLKVVGSRGHYCELSHSLIEQTNLVVLGLLSDRLTIEASAPIYGGDGLDAYITDRWFIERQNLTGFYSPLPPEWGHCISKGVLDKLDWDEAMSTPGAYINADGEACYGSAVFLSSLIPPSNKSAQLDQPSAGP